MAAIRCPHCGSPVQVRGRRWECGWCGDSGDLSSLPPSEKAKLVQIRNGTSRAVFPATVTDDAQPEQEEATPAGESREPV